MPAPDLAKLGAEHDDGREAQREAWIFVGSIAAAFGLMIASLIVAVYAP